LPFQVDSPPKLVYRPREEKIDTQGIPFLTHSTSKAKRAEQISYVFLAALFVLIGWLHLATPLLAALFSLLALRGFQFGGRARKGLSLTLFLVLVSLVAYGLAFFVREAIRGLPDIVEKAVPTIIRLADEYKVETPFTDYGGFKAFMVDMARDHLPTVGNFALALGTQTVFLLIGVVVAVSIFFKPQFELDRAEDAPPANFYSLCSDEISARLSTLFSSFAKVMGAQLAISTINTVLTLIFVLSVGMPHLILTVGATFLCGLLPVVGNLISNTIIVAIGLTVSPKLAIAALVFLVAIHKLEYLLNSRIIGSRIRNPIWLMLLTMILGERLMGIPGMILAPSVIFLIKVEMSKIRVEDPPAPATR
jgi:predicted PurR-regulated permease PerM